MRTVEGSKFAIEEADAFSFLLMAQYLMLETLEPQHFASGSG
jgi:hypothetical protein